MAAVAQPAQLDALAPIRQLLHDALALPYRGVIVLPDKPPPAPEAASTVHCPRSSAPNRQALFKYLKQLSVEASFVEAHTR
jgi:hypothetical protein